MNNLSNSMKKFVSNKNTITILGVVICIGILYFAYNMRLNQAVVFTPVPYANQTIQPRTEITPDMISQMSVPQSFLVGSYYNNAEDIIGKFSNYNTIIAEGSLFYTDLVIEKNSLPDAAFRDLKEGYTPVIYDVDMTSTYANSMLPEDIINIYFKAKDETGTIMFGKFISNIEILDVKDSSGRHVFENSAEARTPAYMLFALPEETHLLFRKALYLGESYDVELTLVPNKEELKENDTVVVSSEDIKNFINEKTKMVSVDEILSKTEDKVNGSSNNKKNS